MLALQTIVFPTDGSLCAEAARPIAERLAERHGAALHVLRVDLVPPAGSLGPAALAEPPEPTPLPGGGVEVRRRYPSVGPAVLAYAAEVDADLIVMGTHGRHGFDRFVMGSTVEHVLRRAECPVLTVGPQVASADEGPVLVPVEFSSASDGALETAAALAEAGGAPLLALHVIEPIVIPAPYALSVSPFDRPDLAERVRQTLGRWAADRAAGSVRTEVEVREGDPADQILAVANEVGASLIVQASHGRKGLGRALLGSVAEAVVRRARCPVLTVRLGARRIVRPDADSAAVPVAASEWGTLFDRISSQAARTPSAVTVEVVAPQVGGAVYDHAPLAGLTYDPHDDAVEVFVEGGGHHVVRPFAIRAREEDEDLTIEVVREDGARERIIVVPLAEPAVAA